jgi:cytochrome c-type protein NapB
MKTKLLTLTVASVFTLGSQAFFFDSNYNWNNLFSTKDSVKEVKINTTKTTSAIDMVREDADSVDVASLRGTHVLDSISIAPEKFKWIKKNVEFERSFDDQPPLIPHKTAGAKISFTKNSCLDCHSDENYKEQEADKMSSTHFFTRDNVRLKKMSPRRYFCLQCHVPQADVDALVDNDFINLDE